MISTYHTIFLITFIVSIALLLFLALYIPIFHVFHAIGWLTGFSKRKEMQSYDENGMSTTTKAVNKKKESSKDKLWVSSEASASAVLLGISEEPSDKASKPEKPPKENVRKSSQGKKSTTEQFTESETECFDESSGTGLFVENSVEDTTNKQRDTDIFSEASTSANETVEEASKGTDIFAKEVHETSIFAETAEDILEYCGTDILSDKYEEPAYRSTDILSDDEKDNDEIFISVGSEIPGDNNSLHDTELLEDGEA